MRTEVKKGIVIGLLISLVVVLRFIKHPINATPITALILFSAAFIADLRWKILVPALAIVVSDLLIEIKNGYGFHSATIMVYSTFALIFFVGYLILRKTNVFRALAASVVSSTLFFFVTNFAFFYPQSPVPNPALGHYPHNWTGILASYEAGLPFYKNMFLGDLFFTGLLFGSYFLITQLSWFKEKSLA